MGKPSKRGIKEVAYVDIKQGGGAHAHHATAKLAPMTWFDCAGGGQVVVERGIAYVGNMRNPHGTTIIDVKDPKHPKLLAELPMPPGTHSHKVRVSGDIMITNREALGVHALNGEVPPEGYPGGLEHLRRLESREAEAHHALGNDRQAGPRVTRAACTASISTAATPTSRRRWTATSATS